MLLISQGAEVTEDFVEFMSRYAINPGTMHEYRCGEDNLRLVGDDSVGGLVLLYHPSAHSLRDYGYDRIAKIDDIESFASLWAGEKRIRFDDAMLSQNTILDAISLEANKTYVIYGAGKVSEVAVSMVSKAGGKILCFADSDEDKWGTSVHGYAVISPDEMMKRKNEYDQVLIGSSRYYREIRSKLRDMGLSDEQVTVPLLIEE